MKRLRSLAGAGLLGLLLAGAMGWAAWSARASLAVPYAGWSGPYVDVEIPEGADASTVLAILERHGVVRPSLWLRLWLRVEGRHRRIRAGEYRFREPVTATEAIRRLVRGEALLHPVTIPEGLTLREVARRLAKSGLAPEEALLEAFRDPSPIRDWDPAAEDLEGYLFPETYHFLKQTPASRIAATMVARFRDETGAGYQEAARRVGLSLRQAVTLASMIEAETSVPEERAMISGVFHNRLRRGMKLQCDPTVLYALEREGRTVGRLLYKHLEVDSPYNTYRYPGLPPGPICNPGWESLEAAVHPAETDALYFVAAPGGGHVFSRTLAEHEAAVRRWRRHTREAVQ